MASGESAIEWTERTLNTWTGCTRKSAGCARCYIDRQPPLRIAHRTFRKGVGKTLSPDQPDSASPLRFHLERLDAMVRRRKPTVYFVNSMSDTFHEDVPTTCLDLLFEAMRRAPQHTFQVLTKRPERMRDYLLERMEPAACVYAPWWPLPNVWLGVTVENRAQVKRADVLRDVPAAVRFLSCEPLLGPLLYQRARCLTCRKGPESIGVPGSVKPWGGHTGGAMCPDCEGTCYRDVSLDLSGIDWVIGGGESGPDARPCREEWLRDLRDACQRESRRLPAGTGWQVGELPGQTPPYPEPRPCRFFLKQLGGHPDKRGGDRALLDGRLWHDMPPLHVPEPAQGALLA